MSWLSFREEKEEEAISAALNYVANRNEVAPGGALCKLGARENKTRKLEVQSFEGGLRLT